MTHDELRAEVEAGLLHAIRRAWRQLQPDWPDLEAAIVASAATAAIARVRPDLDDAGVLGELVRFGIVQPGDDGKVRVAVPRLPGEPAPALPVVKPQ